MANTTSGTVTFDKKFAVDEIIQEAYERIGISAVSGYQLKTARTSLNLLFQEWGNRGLHYWQVAETNIDLIEDKLNILSIEQVVMVQVLQQLLQQVFTEWLMY